MLVGIEKKEQNCDYIGMFDLIKGLFMILIILGHSVTDNYHYWEHEYSLSTIAGFTMSLFNIFRYGFVPMFFMICGYSFRRKSMRTCVKRQLYPVIKPYFWVAVSVTGIAVLKKLIMGRSVMDALRFQALPYLLGFCPGEREFLGIYMDSIGPIWFVLAYALAGLLLNLVIQEKRSWVQCSLIAILGVLGVLLKNITLPFCIQQAMICCGYMYAGMQLKKNKILYEKNTVYLWTIVVLLCIIGGVFGGNVEVSQNVWNNGASDLVISYLAGICLLQIFIKLNVLCGSFAEKIRWLGRYALWICCIHTVSYTVVPWEKFANFTGLNLIANITIEFVVSMVFAVGICRLIEIRNKRKRRG